MAGWAFVVASVMVVVILWMVAGWALVMVAAVVLVATATLPSVCSEQRRGKKGFLVNAAERERSLTEVRRHLHRNNDSASF